MKKEEKREILAIIIFLIFFFLLLFFLNTYQKRSEESRCKGVGFDYIVENRECFDFSKNKTVSEFEIISIQNDKKFLDDEIERNNNRQKYILEKEKNDR